MGFLIDAVAHRVVAFGLRAERWNAHALLTDANLAEIIVRT
jgi:hypothetical protein